ncbi:MAG: TIGR01777 family oxidoreductase [Sulfurimonas sp.]|nr:TIGR01777 family oxidoreductase [Sulfurimonas sp.]
MKIAITGASGFVAKQLRDTFSDIVAIERKDSEEAILEKLKGVDVVINLAGSPIINKWTEEYKKLLLSSRIETTKKIVKAINQSDVKHFISTSAIGAYPDNIACDEQHIGYGDDFLGQLTKAWEAEANMCEKPTTILRFGVILGKDGGALAQMLLPFRLGLGGVIGNGKMMMSWIDSADLMNIYKFVIDKKATGVFNAVSPEPISNYIFTKALGKVLNRPTLFPLPEFVLRIIYGEGATVLTGSKEIYPKALSEAGFIFEYPTIDASLTHLLVS